MLCSSSLGSLSSNHSGQLAIDVFHVMPLFTLNPDLLLDFSLSSKFSFGFVDLVEPTGSDAFHFPHWAWRGRDWSTMPLSW